MKSSSDRSIEFEAVLGNDGIIRIPAEAARLLPSRGAVVVRVAAGRKDPLLAERGVTEDEIEAVASMQMESREQAVKFLSAEGRLASVRRSRGKGR